MCILREREDDTDTFVAKPRGENTKKRDNKKRTNKERACTHRCLSQMTYGTNQPIIDIDIYVSA